MAECAAAPAEALNAATEPSAQPVVVIKAMAECAAAPAEALNAATEPSAQPVVVIRNITVLNKHPDK